MQVSLIINIYTYIHIALKSLQIIYVHILCVVADFKTSRDITCTLGLCIRCCKYVLLNYRAAKSNKTLGLSSYLHDYLI